jgi:uroporphyrinogen decarboxylase
MTSRDRILQAISHKEGPLPIDFGSLHSSLHVEAYESVLEYLGWKAHKPVIQDYFQMIVFPCRELLDLFGTDCIPIHTRPGRGWSLDISRRGDSEYFTLEWGIELKKPKDGFFFDLNSNPLKNAVSAEDIMRYKFPDPEDPARVEGLKEKLGDLRRTGDKALVLFCPTAGIFEHSYFLRGLPELLMDLVLNPAIADCLAERMAEWQQAFFTAALKEIGEYIDIVQVGDDLGTTNGLLMSRDMYVKFYKRRHRAIVDSIKRVSNASIYFHSCGAIREVIPDLIDVGVEILNPVQVRAAGMDSAGLKRDFGRDITFWGGGCDPNVLTSGSKKEVEDEVKRRIEDLCPGGGFVFAPIHNIQTKMPAENIAAMFRTALEYR